MNPLETVGSVAALACAGVLAPQRPDRLARAGLAIGRYGPTPAAGYAAGAARHPHRTALIDDRGLLTFAEAQRRTDRLAAALSELGIGQHSRVALLCRNHRGPVEALVASSKLGAGVVLCNTALSPGQLGEVLAELGADLLVADEEFDATLGCVPAGCRVIRGWVDEPRTRSDHLEALVAAGGAAPLPLLPRQGAVIVLTSGTTGTPKGARRPDPRGLGPAGAILSRIPLRSAEPMLVAAPLFHTWGFGGLQLGMLLGAPLVLQRQFDPAAAMRAIAQHRVTTVLAVPVMLHRILELSAAQRDTVDTSSVRIVALAGSALPAWLAERITDRFGPVVYNLYGSTEVSWASIATPEDLRTAPGTVGRAPMGTRVRILDDAGHPVGAGRTGRIFVGNEMLFAGYTRDGAAAPTVHGLMGTGDVGHVDQHGLLHVTGRSDDMIVSGGENVHPGPVEELIHGWPQVRDVAVIGVPDDEFGQRLAAHLVLEPGAVLDADAVRERVRRGLARFAVPRDVVFHQQLPRNATGKVVKSRL